MKNGAGRSPADCSRLIKAEALRLGFSACGVSPAEAVDTLHRDAFLHWLDEGGQAGMDYMARHTDKRLDPTLLVEGARSVISVALNYYPARQIPPDEYQLAWYAYGEDYHTVMKDKLAQLLHYVATLLPGTEGRAFCDTAPLLERYWAWQGGLGWIGRHTQLVIPHAGSAFFLGELVINQPLACDTPQRDRCGTCDRCLRACPTGALHAPCRLDARRCLSYLTIENRGDIPAEAASHLGNGIYGCDRCLRACPWMRFARPGTEPRLQPRPELLAMRRADWESLSVERYRALFKGSAVKRAKHEGMMRNIHLVAGHDDNAGTTDAVAKSGPEKAFNP